MNFTGGIEKASSAPAAEAAKSRALGKGCASGRYGAHKGKYGYVDLLAGSFRKQWTPTSQRKTRQDIRHTRKLRGKVLSSVQYVSRGAGFQAM
jgi:hypothetical protein